MGRRNKQAEGQETLIDVQPENVKKILSAAKAYQKVRDERADLKAKEKSCRQKLIDLVKDSGAGMVDGQWVLDLEGFRITVAPQAEKVSVVERGDDDSDDEGDEE